MSDAPALAVGAEIDRYVVEAVIGVGGMATVYRIRHRALGTTHALKLLTIDRPAVRRRIQKEARVQATIRHPNLVAVTDVIELDGSPALVLEYVHGPALDRLLWERHLTLAQIDLLARGLLRGVAYAHKHGAIHRDLKPSNVLIDVSQSEPTPKVADFGLVKLVDDDASNATRAGTMMGTPAYMSPEQFQDASSVDARTDVWALGAVLFELVTGTRAFPAQATAEILGLVVQGRYADPRDVVPDLPLRMEAAIRGALTVDRDERIGSVEELLSVWCGDVPDERVPFVYHRPPPVWDAAAIGAVRDLAPEEIVPVVHEPTSATILPARRSRALPLALALGVVGVAAVLLVAGLAGFAVLFASDPDPAPIAEVTPPEPAPPTPAPQPQPEVAPEPVVAAPTVAPAQPARVVEVAPRPKPAPAEGERVAPAEPVPVEVAAPAAEGPRFEVRGDTERVYLVGSGGRSFGPGSVPPGDYTLVAYFGADERPTEFRKVHVDQATVLTVKCTTGMRMCR